MITHIIILIGEFESLGVNCEDLELDLARPKSDLLFGLRKHVLRSDDSEKIQHARLPPAQTLELLVL